MWSDSFQWLPELKSTSGIFFYSFLAYMLVICLGLIFGEHTETHITMPIQDYKKEIVNKKEASRERKDSGSFDRGN